MPRRPTITLAFLLAALLISALPRSATAAPVPRTTATPTAVPSASPSVASSSFASPSAQSVAGVCSLSGLVPARGSNCPASGRLRGQWRIPAVLNPVHVVKKVVGGVVGGAASTAINTVLAAILGWVASGAESALKDTAKVIDQTTSPQLTSSWFSASYWRVAGISALLTIPFLCAAAIHAIVRSDLGLLTRAAFGYLPLSLLAVGIASQLTMLLLAATDEMASIVASASAHADGVFLSTTSVGAIAASVATQSPFVTFLVAIITVAATLALWLELLVRNAAVYVIVLMLPLFFAAMVWPARRTLAIRAIETLIALILSKFAIVAVLSLGGSALGHSTIPGAASVLTGGTLVLLASFTPWALLRMLPLHEVASAAAGGLSQAPRQALSTGVRTAMGLADGGAALGGDEIGRLALPAGDPSNRGGGSRTGGRSASETGYGPEPEPSWSEPVDPSVAEPVIGAMAGTPAASDQGGPETDTVSDAAADLRPSTEIGDADPSGDSAGSATDHPGTGAGSTRGWTDILTFPGAAEDDPRMSLGDDMRKFADARQLPPAGTREAAAEPSSAPPLIQPPPTAEPPFSPPRDAIGQRPANPRRTTAGSDDAGSPTPRVAPTPELGFDPLGGGNAS